MNEAGLGVSSHPDLQKDFALRSPAAPYRPLGGSEMGERIGGHDWAATPLGPLQAWPQCLRTVVDLMLASRQPVCIAWGEELVFLYNDAYAPILGSGHPDSLGKRYPEVW